MSGIDMLRCFTQTRDRVNHIARLLVGSALLFRLANAAATPVAPTPLEPCVESFDGVSAPALPSGWVATNPDPGDGTIWVTSTTLPESPPNDAFIGDQDGVSDKVLDSPRVPIPSDSTQLAFRNNFNTEFSDGIYWDGFVLEVSSPNISGGNFLDITDPLVGGSFVSGGYTGQIDGSANNPLAGRMAWSGDSGGYINTIVNLGPNLVGQTITLRFRMGSDLTVGAPGVRIDNISIVGTCFGNPTPTPTSTATATAAATATPTATAAPTPTPTPTPGVVGVFYDTGSLHFARRGHTATLLPNGKVLVSYGPGELYDPASGSWAITGNGGEPYAATLLPNGKVLSEGGEYFNGHVVIGLPYAFLYDPASGTLTETANLTTARYDHAATLLPNGSALVTGGVDIFPVASAEAYDPASATWSATGSLITARAHHSETLLLDGKVLVAGGDSGYGNGVMGSAELYDPASRTWTATGSLGVPRYQHTATLLPDGRVLVTGGANGYDNDVHPLASAELFDPASGTWSSTSNLSVPRYHQTATLLPNGMVLVAGGRTGFPGGTILAGAELYNPASGTWTATGSLHFARAYHTATLLPDGKVLIAGGIDGSNNTLASAELYVGPPVPPASLNISTRLRVLPDDKALIGGFIITGTELKRVLIRGMGPSLNSVGVTLSDPTLELHQDSTTVATNDNWKMRPDGTSQQADIEATIIPPTNDLESAILAMLRPGAYTAILAGKNGGTGVGLVEVYDLGQGANSKLANISTRGFVDMADNVMIGGFIVGGGSAAGTARVIVRALGPSVPVAGALGDPTLELHDRDGALIASNDNWRSDQEAEILATTIPPSNDLESAIVRTFAPGNYTAIVRGVNGTTGVALVEAYGLN